MRWPKTSNSSHICVTMHILAIGILVIAQLMVFANGEHSYQNMYSRSGKTKKDIPSDANSQSKCKLEIACRDATGQSDGSTLVKLPILQGPQGPIGSPGLPGQRGMAGEPGNPGIPGRSAPIVKKISFFVHLSVNVIKPPQSSQKVVFDDVITNQGGAYDPKNGVFTAPLTGTYQIFVKIAAQGRRKAAVDVRQYIPESRSSRLLFALWSESVPWATTANQALVHLPTGGQIYVEYRSLNNYWYLHGYTYTSFSGFLVSHDSALPIDE